ncbi:sensor histidine kinase [Desulfosediminicola flagellatus]|uniref:sensor histidine kinase n=1 Tax=Desulfosediminicola flagellatus TaxID=2569541 RepID=UPI0010AD691E|nr:HAMP domain-containing sensor histidine kinase [Desulfosediminicola flagellatus]
MYFGLSKSDFTFARWKSALPIFLLIFLSIFALSLILTFSLRSQIQRGELRETEQLLATYLRENSSARLQFAPPSSRDKTRLNGLTFVRISRGNDKLLLANDAIVTNLFQELLHLDRDIHKVWLKRKTPEYTFVWTVVSRRLENGVELLAGKESIESYERYHAMIRAVAFSLALAFGISSLAALLCVKRMLSPLQRLHDELEQLVGKGKGQLLLDDQCSAELQHLYNQINRLITQNRRLVEEMQGSLDNVAHDLRTPMTRLRSVAEFGLREDSDIEKLRESLADCLEESERVLSMLRIMMSVAEAETGTMQLERDTISVKESIEEMISLYEYVADERRITISSHIDNELTIFADKTRIAQVWANLLDNAIKYGKEGGMVDVNSGEAGANILITFRDDGMGISPSEQRRIWDRLYRGDRSRSQQGLGLGLNFVKAIVESHGGTVSVESTLYEGSTFSVLLPRYQHVHPGAVKEKSNTSGE